MAMKTFQIWLVNSYLKYYLKNSLVTKHDVLLLWPTFLNLEHWQQQIENIRHQPQIRGNKIWKCEDAKQKTHKK